MTSAHAQWHNRIEMHKNSGAVFNMEWTQCLHLTVRELISLKCYILQLSKNEVFTSFIRNENE